MPASERWAHAAFATPDGAGAALDRLARLGVSPSDIEVRSSIPLHDVSAPGISPRSRVPLMAVVGGLLGGTAAFLLMSLSSQAYPLPTGGMPIVPLLPAGVITFEGMAIGAILCTVITVLVECGLPAAGRGPGPLDAHIAAGQIVVGVRSSDLALTDWARGALATADA
jgi:hypothetical protein